MCYLQNNFHQRICILISKLDNDSAHFSKNTESKIVILLWESNKRNNNRIHNQKSQQDKLP